MSLDEPQTPNRFALEAEIEHLQAYVSELEDRVEKLNSLLTDILEESEILLEEL